MDRKEQPPQELTLKERVGKNIKDIRVQNHMKQSDLAELLEVSPAYLSAVERGASGISMELLDKLCRKLNTSADCFLYGQKETADEETERLNGTIQLQNGIIRALMRGRQPLEVLEALLDELGLPDAELKIILDSGLSRGEE